VLIYHIVYVKNVEENKREKALEEKFKVISIRLLRFSYNIALLYCNNITKRN
jgi:hypothetical protein